MGFGAKLSIVSMSALAAGLGIAAPAWAQPAATGAGEEISNPDIVVTAQRRTEKSVDVPITVSTLSQTDLATANVSQLSDTVKLTPGLRFDSAGPAVQPTIRGVGTAITTSGGGPNVGIYVDGFFQSNTYVSDFQLMKAQNIQVLKGPQGTLFGRNTTGGAILVTTADPSTETSAEFRASYGRFNTLTLQGYATFGLTDKVAMDVEGIFSRGDGFQTNVLNGDDKVGRYKSWSVRTGIKADLSDSVSVLLRYIHSQSDNPSSQLVNAFVDTTGEAGFFNKVSAAGQAVYGRSSSQGVPLVYNFAPPGTFVTRPGQVALSDTPYFHTRSDTVQGTIKADIGFADLTSYTQYRYDNTPYTGDLDATALPFFGIFVGVRDATFSQEFLLTSKPGSRLQWTVGANYFQVRDTWDVQSSFTAPFGTFSPFGGSSTFTKSIAAFADATYAVVPDRLFLTVGGRFSHDVVTDAYFESNGAQPTYEDVDGSAKPLIGSGQKYFVDNLKNDSFTPRAVIRYKPDNNSSIYASYSRGYKAGILNVGGLSKVPVKPEKIDAFEVGYKYGDRALSVDVAGFYYNYKNLQVSSFQNGAAQIRNAASSEIYGAEAQLRYKLSQAFTVNGGATWTHARYKSFTNAPYYSYCDPNPAVTSGMACVNPPFGAGAGSITQTTTDASGYHMQRAPSWTGNVGASYGLDLARGRLTLSGNLYYTSSFYFDPSQQFRQKPYETLSLRAQWVDPSEKYTLAVYGDNVTNRRYQTQVLFNTLGIGSVWNSPVTYGVSAGVKF